jgi:hypothetical protein
MSSVCGALAMKSLFLGSTALLFISIVPVIASPITATGSFEFLDNRSANDAGVGTGTLIQFGENSVVPNGQNGTTATARLGAGSPIPLPNLNEGINSNLFTRTVTDSAANRGSWTLDFTNGLNTASRTTPSISTALTALPFVTSVSVSGTGLTPTLNWTDTASTLDAVAVRIRDNGITAALTGKFSASVISLNYFAPTTTSFQIPTGLLTAGHEYSFEIDQLQTRTPIHAGEGNGAIFVSTLNQSRAFFDYSASATSLAASSVFLPTGSLKPDGTPSYSFSIQI